MRMIFPALAGLVAVILAPQAAYCWGNEGHEIVALTALRILQSDAPDVADKVVRMLNDDKDPLTGHDIAAEATWADVYRDRGPKPKSATSQWHFIDIEIDGQNAGNIRAACPPPTGSTGTPASDGSAKSCVTEKIREFTQELADTGTLSAERLLALKFLLHFVGDVHQPLHASDRHDQGGNCVGVLPGHSTRPIKLHSYWDTTVVVHALSGNTQNASEALLALVTPVNKKSWQSDNPDQWAQESFELAKTVAYNLPQPPERTGFEFPPQFGKPDPCGPVDVFGLSAAYEEQAEQRAKEQLAKAAVRLAFLLQRQLEGDPSEPVRPQ
jgi:hypothetical protein